MVNIIEIFKNLFKKHNNLNKEELIYEFVSILKSQIINSTGIEVSNIKLDKKTDIRKEYTNIYDIKENIVYFLPINDGYPTCPFEFYNGKDVVISNKKVFSEIKNLDEILIKMTELFDVCLDSDIIIDPYGFMLELTDELEPDYKGNAKLVVRKGAIVNNSLKDGRFEDARKYFINRYLDHFIGWNFGLSVNRNEELKNKLEKLNDKVIEMGIREYAGAGFEVYGVCDIVTHGLQHYRFKRGNERIR